VSEYYWFVLAGLLLVGVVMSSALLRRLPVSTSIIYLGVGLLLGNGALEMVSWNVVRQSTVFEHLTEIAVIVSLFTVGLNWRISLGRDFWSRPVRLATVSMVLTICALALVGTTLLGLPLGAAVLLGAVLAPTDPVLASDVQVKHPTDQDSTRQALTGEAGLNDGLAFPFVMLGLGLMGLHPSSSAGLFSLWSGGEFGVLGWLGWDVVWAIAVGTLVGGLTGRLVGRLSLLLHDRNHQIFSLHEFLVLGVIALSYGLAELVYGYGFLAVFAAGYAVRRIEMRATGFASEPEDPMADTEETEEEAAAREPGRAAQYMAASLERFNGQLERILQAAVVVLVGAVLVENLTFEALWLAPLLFLVIRPLSVLAGLARSGISPGRKALVCWFGIRGLGSVFYLTYALSEGVPDPVAGRLASIVISVVAVSILVHGISVTPIMSRYESGWRKSRDRSARG
jgi:NhaP-type Na+/H+ or K+/H+ antiporter